MFVIGRCHNAQQRDHVVYNIVIIANHWIHEPLTRQYNNDSICLVSFFPGVPTAQFNRRSQNYTANTKNNSQISQRVHNECINPVFILRHVSVTHDT